MNNVVSFKFNDNTILLSCDAAAKLVIPLHKMTWVKSTKYWLNELAIMKENRRNTNPTFISEVTLNENLFEETSRYVFQPSSIHSISIVVESTNSDLAIAFVLGITSDMNLIHDLKFHSLKNFLPKNENEAFDHLIIPSLMISLMKVEHDKIKTSEGVTFGLSEKVT